MNFNMYDIINKKKNGKKLSKEEIEWCVKGYTCGDIPDYQMSALTMAIYFTGLDMEETAALTMAMMNSGDIMHHNFGGITADKHSTGGVGDKTTLIIAPIVAANGIYMPKMSGRGLGHTGGTIDKLESIPGFRTELSETELESVVKSIGLSVVSQSGNLCPADKKLYALRDSTATVDSIPLIASSVMSKKLATGADCILLDVKCGSGAFMKTLHDAQRLAAAMVEIAKSLGRKCRAVITDMNVPLGMAVGNSLEFIEAIEVLKGHTTGRLTEVSLCLAANILEMAGKGSYDECLELASNTLYSGMAIDKLREMITAQGGNAAVIDDYALFPQSRICYELKSEKSGYISAIFSEECGRVSMQLGGGRERKEDAIDHSAGIVFKKTVGNYVNAGDTLALLYTCKDNAEEAGRRLLHSIMISDTAPAMVSPILGKCV